MLARHTARWRGEAEMSTKGPRRGRRRRGYLNVGGGGGLMGMDVLGADVFRANAQAY